MTCSKCGTGNWIVADDNGVTDPANGVRIEWCECQECGHEWRQTLV